MADQNYNPNASYDNGPNAAGSNGVSPQATLTSDATSGLQTDSALKRANLRVGLNAAGVSKNNIGPNAAGQPNSING